MRLIWITHGQGRVILGARRRGIGVHNFIFVPANQPFSLDAGANLNGHIVECPPGSGGAWPSSPTLLRLRETAAQMEIAGLIDAIGNEVAQDRPLADEALAAHTRLASIWLRRQLQILPDVEEKDTAADRMISAFFDALERNYTKGWTMADYALHLDVTPTHLSRVCKAKLGHSAADFIVQRALFAARKQLVQTKEPAKEIAASLGFGSAAYFSRFILAHTGKSPRDLRAMADKAS